MYRKIHRRLTFVFTGIASLILIVMSACCYCLCEKMLQKNSFLSFSEETHALLSNLEQQTVITHEWLSKFMDNGRLIIAVYDKDVPLSCNDTALSSQSAALIGEILFNCAGIIQTVPESDFFHSAHKEFDYISSTGEHFYTCFARIRKPREQACANLTAVILCSAHKLSEQLMISRICFFTVNVCGILLLFLFSWHYTKRLLSPVQKSQENQAAFIAAASHELRTPLCVILSSVSALKYAQPDKKEQFLNTIENESRRMSRLVTDLLTLAQAGSHTWSLCPKETELDTLLLDTLDSFQPLAAEKEISLTASLPDKLIPPLLCDPERISQVLGVLISNAISYGKKGGFVKLALTFQNGVFLFQVADNGTGISKEAKEHIFDRFYREDPSRSQKEHLGLGLCIAKEILDAHGGSIQVTDTPGGGTTFTVRLKK